jgi:HSF-type DNA-binding
MKRYFRHDRFKSFLRQLSMYKFVRVTEGPFRGSYGHPQFLKRHVELSRFINRGDKDEDKMKNNKSRSNSISSILSTTSDSATNTNDETDRRVMTPSPALNKTMRSASSWFKVMPSTTTTVTTRNSAAAIPMTFNPFANSEVGDGICDFAPGVKIPSLMARPDILDEIICTFGSPSSSSTNPSLDSSSFALTDNSSNNNLDSSFSTTTNNNDNNEWYWTDNYNNTSNGFVSF